MMRPRKFRTEEARRRERRRLLIRAALTGTLVATLVGAVVYALHQPFARITAIEFEAHGTLLESDLASVAHAALSGASLGVIPNDSLLFPRTAHVERALRDAFPRIAEVRVVRRTAHALEATVRERTPEALWCGDIVPPVRGDTPAGEQVVWGTCYLVDQTGFIYDRAPAYSDATFVRFYGPLERAQPLGQYLVEEEEFRSWLDFAEGVGEYTDPIVAFLFVDERDVELYQHSGVRLIVPRTESTAVLNDRLGALLTSDTVDYTKPIEYLDLRFGSKVFVKYRNDVPAEEPSVDL